MIDPRPRFPDDDDDISLPQGFRVAASHGGSGHQPVDERGDPRDEEDENCEDEPDEDEEAGLTLEDLQQEMVAAASEARRGNRRTLEVLKNFGAVLDALSATVNDTHKAVRNFPAAGLRPQDAGDCPREWALALVELADRIQRVNDGFSRPPAAVSSMWPGTRRALAAWSEAWSMQADALAILQSHLESLLKRAGLMRLEVLGKAFDPHTMTAVESTVDSTKPDHTVLAEILPGWRIPATDQLIRPAQVRVSRTGSR